MDESTQTGGGVTQTVVVHQTNVVRQANSIGLAGFIVSLVGFLSCGLLSPIGFLLSLIGLARPPRGFAIAGTIIGGLGSLFLATFGFAFILTIVGMGTLAEAVQVYTQLSAASTRIDNAEASTGEIPSTTEGQILIDDMIDKWGTGLRYLLTDEGNYVVASAGPDMEFDTEDDVTTEDLSGGSDDGG